MPYPTNDVSGVVNEQLYISPIFTIFFTLEYRSFFPFFTSLTIRVNSENCPLFTIGNTKKTNFTWEQRELLEVAKYRNGKAHENEIDESGEYVVVNSKFVSTDGKIMKFTNNQIEPLYKGELAFVLSDVPNGKAIARTFLIQENNRYSLNQRIAGITPLELTHSYFLSILMNRNKYFLSFDDGAKQTNLSKIDVEKFDSLYPNYLEQSKIGSLFENVDTLITLHQRKYIHLI